MWSWASSGPQTPPSLAPQRPPTIMASAFCTSRQPPFCKILPMPLKSFKLQIPVNTSMLNSLNTDICTNVNTMIGLYNYCKVSFLKLMNMVYIHFLIRRFLTRPYIYIYIYIYRRHISYTYNLYIYIYIHTHTYNIYTVYKFTQTFLFNTIPI